MPICQQWWEMGFINLVKVFEAVDRPKAEMEETVVPACYWNMAVC